MSDVHEHDEEHSHLSLSPEEQSALDALRAELNRIANQTDEVGDED